MRSTIGIGSPAHSGPVAFREVFVLSPGATGPVPTKGRRKMQDTQSAEQHADVMTMLENMREILVETHKVLAKIDRELEPLRDFQTSPQARLLGMGRKN